MKREIKRLSSFLFLLFLFFAMAGISEADIEGTIGTRFTITDSGFGTKKPRVYIQYQEKPRVVKKVYAKVEKWSDTSIACLWTQTLSAGTYNLWVKPNIVKANPIAEGTFTIMPPSIDEETPGTLTAGATITISGQFFTNKNPTVYLRDLVSLKKKSCRVLSSTMDPATGASSLNFVVPKWGSGKYGIILQTLVGEVTTLLPLPLTLSTNPTTLSPIISNSSYYDYYITLTAMNGVPPYLYSCSISGGSDLSVTVNLLEPSFSGAFCHISGTPLTHGLYAVNFSVTDSAMSNASAAPISFTVNPLSTAIDHWQWRSPLPQGNSLYSLTYGNGTFAAVGDFGTILTSPDGVAWTSRDSGTISPFNGVTYGNGTFVSVGSTIMTSPDGVAWTYRDSATTRPFNGVTYGNGTFVAVEPGFGNPNGSPILTSPDGVTWTKRHSGVVDTLLNVTYGDGTFVAIGYSSDGGTILTSPDGVTWTKRHYPGIINELDYIIYGHGTFVAVGYGGPHDSTIFVTSHDGATWTTSYSTDLQLASSLNYVNGTFEAEVSGNYETVAPNGIDVTTQYGVFILTSPDGVTWTSRNVGTSGALPADITYGNGIFVALGGGGTIVTSPDGIAWSSENSIINHSFDGVTYGNGTFVAVGSGLDAYGNQNGGTLFTSPDGIAWSSENSGNMKYLNGVTYGNGTFVVVGYSTGGTILTSHDGVAWSSKNSGTTNSLNGVTYGNGTFVAVGGGGTILTSPDGVTWSSKNSGTTNGLTGATYGNGTFVVVGGGGTILTSPDGVTWTSKIFGTTDDLNGVTYGNGTFVAVGRSLVSHGHDGPSTSTIVITTSTDGAAWSSVLGGEGSGSLAGVACGNSTCVAVGDYSGGIILASPDGVTWYHSAFRIDNGLNGITYVNGTFLAVGKNGTIIQSEPVQ